MAVSELLPAPAGYAEHLPAEIGRADRTGTAVALLFLDLEGSRRSTTRTATSSGTAF